MTKQWVRTRRCGCGNCRFNSPQDPEWHPCPDQNKPDYHEKAVWLWRRDYSGEEEQV